MRRRKRVAGLAAGALLAMSAGIWVASRDPDPRTSGAGGSTPSHVLGSTLGAHLTRSDLEAFLLQKYSPYFEQLDIEVKIQSTTGKFFLRRDWITL